jgi:16S rRNA (guanine527-N7)-methyltransferase
VSQALDKLAIGAGAILGRPLDTSELDSFDRYLGLLQKWQRVQRLVGSPDPGWIVENMFLDSLLFLLVMPKTVTAICDVGTGAGFPGIPIKIVTPRLEVTLIEARQRRASFLSEAIRIMGLQGLSLRAIRAEDAGPEMVGSFGAVLLRCAGNMDDLLGPVARLVAPGGLVIWAGPPKRYVLPRGGEWVSVPGIHPGRSRLFAVFHVSQDARNPYL